MSYQHQINLGEMHPSQGQKGETMCADEQQIWQGKSGILRPTPRTQVLTFTSR